MVQRTSWLMLIGLDTFYSSFSTVFCCCLFVLALHTHNLCSLFHSAHGAMRSFTIEILSMSIVNFMASDIDNVCIWAELLPGVCFKCRRPIHCHSNCVVRVLHMINSLLNSIELGNGTWIQAANVGVPGCCMCVCLSVCVERNDFIFIQIHFNSITHSTAQCTPSTGITNIHNEMLVRFSICRFDPSQFSFWDKNLFRVDERLHGLQKRQLLVCMRDHNDDLIAHPPQPISIWPEKKNCCSKHNLNAPRRQPSIICANMRAFLYYYIIYYVKNDNEVYLIVSSSTGPHSVYSCIYCVSCTSAVDSKAWKIFCDFVWETVRVVLDFIHKSAEVVEKWLTVCLDTWNMAKCDTHTETSSNEFLDATERRIERKKKRERRI